MERTAETTFPKGKRTIAGPQGERLLPYAITITSMNGVYTIEGAFTRQGKLSGGFEADREFLDFAARVWPDYGKPEARCVFSGGIEYAQADIRETANQVAAA